MSDALISNNFTVATYTTHFGHAATDKWNESLVIVSFRGLYELRETKWEVHETLRLHFLCSYSTSFWSICKCGGLRHYL